MVPGPSLRYAGKRMVPYLSLRRSRRTSISSSILGLLGFLLCFGFISESAAQKLPFAGSNIRDGLVDTVAFAMMQDSRGFLWIGTRTGLSRFDGLEFQNYTVRDGLAHNVVRSMCEGPDGSLYFGTENGVSILKDGVFDTLGSDLPNSSIRAVVVTDDGVLWMGTYGGGLVRIKDGEQRIYTLEDGLPHMKIRCLLEGRDKSLWIGTYGGGLAQLQDDVIRSYQTGLGDFEIRCLWEEPGGGLLVGTRRGVYRLKGDHFVPMKLGRALDREAINVIASDHRGRLWFGTREAGAFVLESGELRRFTMEDGLPDNSVTAILEDFESNLWFGTYGGGICRLGGEKVLNWEATEGFLYANVYGIAQDRKGCMWFGTNGGGVSRLCDGKFTAFTRADGLAHNKVLSVMQASDGAMWFGTLNGASRFDGNSWSTLNHLVGLAHNVVYGIAEDDRGRMLFATFGGLSILDHGHLRTLRKEDGLAGNRVNFVLPEDGALWLATDHGLTCIRDGKARSWTTADGLASNFINYLYRDDHGALWVATSLGLSRFQDGKFTTWTSEDGLSDDSCTVILPGSDDRLWIGTNRGVDIFDGNGFSIVSSREGLVSDLVNRGAGCVDRQGNLWFGTGEGVSRFAADFKPELQNPPPIHLLEVRVFDQRLKATGGVRLDAGRNWLVFSYVGISFRRAQEIRYRYRLKGTGRPWQESKLREVQFSSLPPGHYVFEVTARLGEGEWNRNFARFPFTIVPPIWERWWFISLVVGLLAAAVLIRIWGLRRRSRLLEEAVQQRTAEIEEVNERLRWLAHHDRLTGLVNRHFIYELIPGELSLLQRRRRQHLAAASRLGDLPCLGIMLVDLDHFKRVNDRWDHMVGDEALKAVADVFRTALRDTDIICRWGGEEFLILLRDVQSHGLEESSRRILETMRALRFPLVTGDILRLSCSIGWTHVPLESELNTELWELLLKVADLNLLEAKRTGRDRAVGCFWTEDFNRAVLEDILAKDDYGALGRICRRVEVL